MTRRCKLGSNMIAKDHLHPQPPLRLYKRKTSITSHQIPHTIDKLACIFSLWCCSLQGLPMATPAPALVRQSVSGRKHSLTPLCQKPSWQLLREVLMHLRWGYAKHPYQVIAMEAISFQSNYLIRMQDSGCGHLVA